jgi:hypothetical protein
MDTARELGQWIRERVQVFRRGSARPDAPPLSVEVPLELRRLY